MSAAPSDPPPPPAAPEIPGHPVPAAVAAASAALAGLAGPGGAVWSLPADGLRDTVQAVLALRARVDGLLLDLLHDADGRGLHTEVGARDTAGWLRAVGRLDPRPARELARLAAALDPHATPAAGRCPATGAALRAGRLDLGHAQVITAAMAGLPAAVDTAAAVPTAAPGDADPFGGAAAAGGLRGQVEGWLVARAGDLDPRGLAVAARELHEALVRALGVVDADDPAEADRLARAERAERDRYARRSVTRRPHADGLTQVRMILTDDVAALLFAALDPLAQRRPADDGLRDERSRPQRYADAVETLAASALAAGDLPEHGGDRPHVTLTIRWETLQAHLDQAGTLDTGHPVSPAQARRWLCDAELLPVVLGGPSQPLDAGRARRTFDRYQRRALLARDGGCAGLGCDPHPHRTHGHHNHHWDRGGPTDLTNGALLCEPWHHKVHAEGWQVRLATNGHPELIPPAWIDPQQRPRQNHRFRDPPIPPPRR